MILFPPAKINLGLHILFKRTDGYHELETSMIPIPFYDILEIIPSETFKFKQTGLTISGDPASNLCVKAYELMKHTYAIPPVMIHLRKIIPMGGGLGGGSSDAAFVVSGLNQLFNLDISTDKLEELAAQLGSDCPFFIKNVPQIAKGRGELLSEVQLNLKGYYLKLINIGIHVGTKEAYAGAKFSNNPKPLADILKQPISHWKNELVNDFEHTVFALHPSLAELKSNMYKEGALYAAMSGSGSTMFGIYEHKPKKSYPEDSCVMEVILKLEV